MNSKIMPLRLARLFIFVSLFFAFNQYTVAQNAIVTENLLPGTVQSSWDANDNGDIEGFPEEFSVNKGETVHFKIDVNSAVPRAYTVKIYRLGYYNGAGARFIADLGNSLSGSLQPTPNYDPVTGKLDCNNWSRSASWAVPSNAVSGVYIARLDCPYFSGSTNKTIMLFVVRDDAANSPVLFKTSDATWQAYNTYGGNTFYGASTPVPGFAHATKISYQRPLHIRGDKSGFFNAEYPMLRWLEKNGYNVTYSTDMDMARDASAFTPSIHKTILSVGHDEYWSSEQFNKIENARNNGVHIAFFSGNEVYWKTRWEDNYQTLVCYKEGTKGELVCGTKCDPLTGVWTGLWRDGCTPTYALNDGCRPEGSLSGQMSWTQSTGSIKVPDTYKNLAFWKNTSVASLGAGQTKTLPYGTLGNEWDPEQLTETYPTHRIILSNTTQAGFTHKMSIYRNGANGAYVFASGTMQWAWGLDNSHDLNTATPPVQPVSTDMKQATVNLLYSYMGVAPGSIEAGLVLPASFVDNTPPTSVITFPVHNTNVPGGTITITGTSTDNGGGTVAGVEVSLDNGATWQSATGLQNWTYTFSPAGYGTQNIRVRAWDDFGNLETVGALGSSNNISVSLVGPFNYSVFNSTYPTNPPLFFTGGSVELGMRFRSSIPGNITGFRYYKAPGTTGVHIGHLWDNTGTLLASETFTNETASGWQSVTLASPVAILPNTTYVVSYFSTSGDFVRTVSFFTVPLQNGFLKGLADGEDGLNGVYGYSATPAFPTNSSLSSNYYADVIFTSSDITGPQVLSVNPANNATGIALNVTPSATFDEALDPATVNSSTVSMKDPGNVSVPGTVSLSGAVITYTPTNPLAIGTTYTLTLKGGTNPPLIEDLSGNALLADYSWSFTTGGLTSPTVTLDPVSQSTCSNSNISFTSAATGIPTPTVQWQVSSNSGVSWSDVLSATSATFSFTALSSDNNNQYRAIWSNSQGSDTSAPAVLTVATSITGNLQAVNANICPGSPLELVLTAATGPSPYSLQVNSTTYNGVTVGQPFRALAADESLWPNSTPQILAQPDNNSVELGVKFQTNKNGYIKGIRFYKGSTANGGTHKGSLWTSSGTLLATATFTNETNSGWQEVQFATPVNVNANTTYVASYFAPQGNYSKDGSYFSTSYSNGNSLTALQNTVSEPNAVYAYGGQSLFPDQNFGDPNYWVDVIFAPYLTTTTTFNLTGITANNGCSVTGNPISSITITVSATVNAGTVSGLSPLCIGASATYSTNGDPGGTWSSSNTLAATVNAVSGVVTAIGAGSSTITYTVNGCNGTAFNSQVVNITPNANPGTITGSSPLCIGATPVFTSDGESGGTWSSTNPAVASVNATTGQVTALTAGSTDIRYTLNVGCNSPLFSFYTVTVNANASAGTVSGTSPLCIGATDTYTSNGDAGGTWTSTNPAVASVNPTSGLVTALTAGTTDITYTVNDCNGPSASFKTLTVNSCASVVNLKLYLEGYYLGGGLMDAVMLNQGVSADPTNTDSITVELHAATAPYALVASARGMLKTNGTAAITFPSLSGSYYIAVIHRNSIQTWSANTVAVGAVPATYDFTTAANKAYGDNMKQLGGVWVFYTGDINQDEFIDVNDFPDFDLDSYNGVSFQYKATDMNGDGFVDANDFPVFDVNSYNGISSVHP